MATSSFSSGSLDDQDLIDAMAKLARDDLGLAKATSYTTVTISYGSVGASTAGVYKDPIDGRVKSKPIPKRASHKNERCSWDCPFDDCFININTPLQPQSGGDGEQGEKSDDNNSDNTSDMDSNADSDNSERPKTDQTPKESGQSDDESDKRDSEKSPDASERDDKPTKNNKSDDSSPPEKSDRQEPDSKKSPPTDSGDRPPEQGNQKGKPNKGDRPKPQNGGQGQKVQEDPVEDYNPVFDPSKELPPMDWHGKPGSQHKKERVLDSALGSAEDQTFVAKLRNVMKDNAYDRRVKGRKRGKLDMRALYKVPAKAENVFTLKQARKNKDYNVVLLVDQSGSMTAGIGHENGKYISRAHVAAQSAIFLARSLQKLDIRYSIMGFDERIRTYKDFDEIQSKEKLSKTEYQMVVDTSGGNCDYSALTEAYSRLNKQTKGKNILIYICDGDPACTGMYSNGGGICSCGGKNSREQIKHLVKSNERTVSTFGVGIHHNLKYVPHARTINNIRELKPQIIDVLKHNVKRG